MRDKATPGGAPPGGTTVVHKFRDNLAKNLGLFVVGFVLTFVLVALGVWGAVDSGMFEDVFHFSPRGDLQQYGLAGALVVGGFALYLAWERFVLRFDAEQVVDGVAFLVGFLLLVSWPLAYFLVAEVSRPLAYSAWADTGLLLAGTGAVVAGVLLSSKPKWRAGSVLLLFGCELVWFALLNFTGGMAQW
ncbi:MAG: hypothetical protein ACTSU5_17305 [Promethearchaeota archaeon]